MKIKFESNDDLPSGKRLNIPVCAIITRSVFRKNDRYYPQVHLKDFFFFEYKQKNEDDSYAIC